MPVSLVTLVLSTISGAITYLFTSDLAMSVIAAAVTAVVVSLGYICLIVLDD